MPKVPDVSRHRWNMVNSKVVAQLPFVVCPLQNSADQEIEWHDVAPCLFENGAFFGSGFEVQW